MIFIPSKDDPYSHSSRYGSLLLCNKTIFSTILLSTPIPMLDPIHNRRVLKPAPILRTHTPLLSRSTTSHTLLNIKGPSTSWFRQAQPTAVSHAPLLPRPLPPQHPHPCSFVAKNLRPPGFDRLNRRCSPTPTCPHAPQSHPLNIEGGSWTRPYVEMM